jgi:hypothetical protein
MFQIRNVADFNSVKKRAKSLFDINLKDQMYNTLLHIVTINDNVELAEIVLKNGADHTLINAAGVSPIFYTKSKDMLKVYLDNIGPDIFTIFNNGSIMKFLDLI